MINSKLQINLKRLFFNGISIVFAIVAPLSLEAEVLFDSVSGTQIKLELAVDLNGDGKIKFLEKDYSGRMIGREDLTSAQRPFNFWLNSDYDVVLQKGVVQRVKTECDGLTVLAGECTMDDVQDRFSSSNSGGLNATRIESLRDLEDFFPLVVRITPWNKELLTSTKIRVWIRSSGSSINVFPGKWDDSEPEDFADDYLRLEDLAREQVKTYGSRVGDTYEVPTEDIGKFGYKVAFLDEEDFDESGVARLIVEGSEGNTQCESNQSNCFIEAVLMDKNNNPITSGKVYTNFRPLADYYTHVSAGTAFPTDEQDFVAPQPFSAIHTVQARLSVDSSHSTYSNNIVLVHGWRMPLAERINFGETAFKRMYWQGFRGNFILASWPTGWFDLPSYEGMGSKAWRASASPQNYDNSEAIARRTGPLLRDYLATLPADKTSIIAHSMGNVVVSEALRSADQKIVQTYVASQAAEVAGAYDSLTPYMLYLERLFPIAWSFINDDEFGIPPDRYSFRYEPTHGPSVGYESLAYYDGIGERAASIVNFSNQYDDALSSWKLNQITKPAGIGIERDFSPNITTWLYEYTPPPPATPETDIVTDQFVIDPPGLLNTLVTTWGVEHPAYGPDGVGNPEYLAHITPGRTDPLGHRATTRGEIDASVDLSMEPYNFNDTGYDHSAQFLQGNTGRNTCYWAIALNHLINDLISRDGSRGICQ